MVVSVEIKKRREEREGGQGRRCGGALSMGEEPTGKATSRTHRTVSWATGKTCQMASKEREVHHGCRAVEGNGAAERKEG